MRRRLMCLQCIRSSAASGSLEHPGGHCKQRRGRAPRETCLCLAFRSFSQWSGGHGGPDGGVAGSGRSLAAGGFVSLAHCQQSGGGVIVGTQEQPRGVGAVGDGRDVPHQAERGADQEDDPASRRRRRRRRRPSRTARRPALPALLALAPRTWTGTNTGDEQGARRGARRHARPMEPLAGRGRGRGRGGGRCGRGRRRRGLARLAGAVPAGREGGGPAARAAGDGQPPARLQVPPALERPGLRHLHAARRRRRALVEVLGEPRQLPGDVLAHAVAALHRHQHVWPGRSAATSEAAPAAGGVAAAGLPSKPTARPR